jgi:hypothetical protein
MTQLKQHYRQQWLIWITHWLKNDRNGPRDIEKWFSYMIMPLLTHQNWRKTPWNCLDGTSFCPRCNPLSWQHLTIASSYQWDTRLQSSTSAILKNCENGSTNVLPQNKNSFSGKVFITYLKDGQSVLKQKANFFNKKNEIPLKIICFTTNTLRTLWVHLVDLTFTLWLRKTTVTRRSEGWAISYHKNGIPF